MILPIRLGERSYNVLVERGALARVGELFPLDRRVLIVTDSGVPKQYSRKVAAACRRAEIVTIPSGEESKSFSCLQTLLSAMAELNMTRADCVVAVGGGVCGDLAGFAASMYMRGVDFYNVPTTLLSQVDSSIGGKTAINFEGVKNLVGAFYQPKGVLIDPDVLATLEVRQFRAGLAEVIKMAMTSNAALFARLESGAAETDLDETIFEALKIKRDVVERDEREAGPRKILNFGHTIGHGIEATATPALLHGECVALGMLPMCGDAARARLLPVLKKAGLPTSCRAKTEAVMRAVLHDKKMTANGVDCVVVEEIGKANIVRLTEQELALRVETAFGGN